MLRTDCFGLRCATPDDAHVTRRRCFAGRTWSSKRRLIPSKRIQRSAPKRPGSSCGASSAHGQLQYPTVWYIRARAWHRKTAAPLLVEKDSQVLFPNPWPDFAGTHKVGGRGCWLGSNVCCDMSFLPAYPCPLGLPEISTLVQAVWKPKSQFVWGLRYPPL